MEVNNRERIEGEKFVKGCVYEVFSNDRYNSSRGIYFYPTTYPDPATMQFEWNSRGALSKTLNKLSEPLKLKIIYVGRHQNKSDKKYKKFDKSTIYGKKPVSIIGNESYFSEKIDLSNLDLSYADLEDSELIRINFTGANFTGAKFTRANLTGSDFTNVNLTGAKLGNTTLKDIISNGIIGIPKTLPKGYYFIDGCIIGPDTKISDDLKKTYKQIEINGKQYLLGPNVDLTDVDLTDVYLTGFNLTGINFTGAKLTGAYLIGVNLTGAKLTGANLAGARLDNANLTGADLIDADITGADLIDAILTGIKTSGIKGIPKF